MNTPGKENPIKTHISSFIHYGDLYSAPSRLLLRSAPDPYTAKEKSFEARVKCVRKNPIGSNLCDKGSPFNTEGPTTENARARVVEVRAKGTKSNACSDERSERRRKRSWRWEEQRGRRKKADIRGRMRSQRY